jgi:hypothetical protein
MDGFRPSSLMTNGLAVDRLGAEVSAPGVIAGSRALRKTLAELVRAGQAAEIRALAGAGAGYEERHVGLLRPQAAAHGKERRQNQDKN